jgi:energy-coupling factor transporter ATP-binding protein EcfA2
VFVSHAGADVALAGQVRGWLVADGHEVFLDRDLHDGIAIGEDWQARLHERLRWADAVVCLLTAAYLGSTWCTAEVAIAQNRGSRLFPVRAEPGVRHPLLASVQQLDLIGDGAPAWARLAEELRRVDAAGGAGWPDDRSPFPGLRPFDTSERRVFFGRAGEVEQLAALLRSPAERADAAVLLVVGPSGCGKSSLVRAGLLPVMATEPGWATLPAILPGTHPVAALTRELAAAARQVGLGWSVGEICGRLDDGGLAELADELLLAGPGSRRTHLLVVVDQFEELLTQAAPAERARFAALLGPALAGSVQVVATLRPEFLDQLLVSPELVGLPKRVHALEPMRRDALRSVIQDPAQLAGIAIDEELVARLVTDTDSGDALPLLAYALEQLAVGVQRGGQLLTSRYEQLGGVQGALARQADSALAEAMEAGGRDRDQVIKELLRLVTVDEQGRPTRWRVRRDELPDAVAAELDAFVARRLLTTDIDDGRVVVGVAHEAFLSAWPPLAEAITAASTALRARRHIEQATADWAQHGQASDRLWERGQLAAALADTGAHLQASNQPSPAGPESRQTQQDETSSTEPPTRRWRHPVFGRRRVLVADRVELTPQARQFLHASIRRHRRRRRRSTTVLSVLLVAALMAAGIAVIQQRASEERQRLATAELLLTRAEAILNGDPRTALQLGEAAYRIRPGPDTQADLTQLLLSPVFSGHSGHNGTVSAGDDEMALWNVTDRARPRRLGDPLTGHTDQVTAVAFAPDGRTLATASADRTVLLWDAADPGRARRLGDPLTAHTAAVLAVSFAPNGRTLTVAGMHRAVGWDLTELARPRRLGPRTAGNTSLSAVAFAPDGRTLATASADRTILLWDLTDPNRTHRLGEPLTDQPDLVSAVAFAPDGRALAIASGNGTVLLWDLTDLNELRDDPLEQACALTQGGLTPDEWDRHVPDLEYVDSCAR